MKAWRLAVRSFLRSLHAGHLTVIVGSSGTLATYSVVRQPPMDVLSQASSGL